MKKGCHKASAESAATGAPDGCAPGASGRTVLFVDHTAKLGGGELALLNLAASLKSGPYRPLVVLASEGALVGRLQAAGVTTRVLPLDLSVVNARKDRLRLASVATAKSAWRCLFYAVRLARFARANAVDVIHTNSLKADIYGGLAGLFAGIPVIWHVRDRIDGLYLPPTVAAAFRLLAHLLPSVVVANSESTLGCLRLRPTVPSCVVYSGFARPLADEGAATAGPPAEACAEPHVALVGRIASWKGQHVFLRAATRVLQRHPQARFWVIGAPLFGEHEYEASLHRLAEQLGVAGRVTFWGFRDDVADLLARTDVLVHASTLGEPFGQAVIEGMAAGKPVVATDGGALPEIVVPGETGFLVPMGEDAPMADAICALLRDPACAAAMGAAGRRRVQERFTIGHTARRVEALYDDLLAGGRPS